MSAPHPPATPGLGSCCAVSLSLPHPHPSSVPQGARPGLVPGAGVGGPHPGGNSGGWAGRCSHSHPDPPPRTPWQEYRAAEQEIQQQMSLGELCYPVPFSFEPVKSFFKGFMDAVQSVLQTPLDIRLKDSKLLCDHPCVLNSPRDNCADRGPWLGGGGLPLGLHLLLF